MNDFPDDFWLGVEQFNQGEFYACHDTLEAVWIEAPEADKRFYQGILQVAVALYHLGNQNWRGGVILLGEGIHRLRSFPSDYAGLDMADFMAEVTSLLSFLQHQGAENLPALQLTIGPGGRGLIAEEEQHRSQPYLDRL